MTNEIKLLPHNEKLYNDIVKEMIDGHKSIFYSEGTGLGKSFIFFKLAHDLFFSKKILYIVPYIFTWENVIHYDEFNLLNTENITMTTFADFNLEEKVWKYADEYDVVFVDECHHMKSDIQGANVDKLLKEMNSRGKFTFGFTATPLVDGIWVDKEYFEVSCYGPDIYEAIEMGLMPKIRLALADINLDEVPEDMLAKYSISGTKKIIRQIVDEHPEITHWLGYFSTIKELEEAEHELKYLFPEFKILSIHSEIEEDVKEIISSYESYDEKTILLSVAMLLEGAHLNTVDNGIMLYRNVQASHTYMQILGRLCKMGLDKSPVFVDMTNAIFNIKSFESFKSDRCVERKTYSKRDIFDTTASEYRYIEMYEYIQFISNERYEYRGIVYFNTTDLSRKLGKGKNACAEWINRCEGRTPNDYIDYCLGELTYEEYINLEEKHEYRGIIYSTMSDLSRKLGKGDNACARWMRHHEGRTPNDYIDYCLGELTYEEYVANGYSSYHEYRGITYSGMLDLSGKLGKGTMGCTQWIRHHEGKTPDDYIDFCLGDLTYEEYIANGYSSYHEYRGITYSTMSDLSRKLGKGAMGCPQWIRRCEGRTPNDYIDYCLGELTYEEYVANGYSSYHEYRGITYSGMLDLSRKLGSGKNACAGWIKRCEGRTLDDYIDYRLGDLTYEEYVANGYSKVKKEA